MSNLEPTELDDYPAELHPMHTSYDKVSHPGFELTVLLLVLSCED